MPLYSNYSLLPYNTFAMDVNAAFFLDYSSAQELRESLFDPKIRTLRHLCIGQGSNLLFRDDFEGVILHSSDQHLTLLEQDQDSILVEVGAGMIWDDFVTWAVSNHYYGVENLTAIPGEVGASAVQNIGAYGVEVGELIHSVETFSMEDGSLDRLKGTECEYSYRNSIFKQELKGKRVVLSVVYRLSKKEQFRLSYAPLQQIFKEQKPTLASVRQTITELRNSKLPNPDQYGNAGSFFMNPVIDQAHFLSLQKEYPSIVGYSLPDHKVKVPAGWLIEQAGWKGKSLGRAGVYKDQALVLVNLGGALPKEIIALAETIVREVEQRFGIRIFPEVNYI